MAKKKNKKQNWWLWFVVGLASYLIIAPNTTIIRVLVERIEPLEFTFLRAAMIVIVAIPFIVVAIPQFNRRNLKYTLGAGLSMTISTIFLAFATKYSTASYAALLGLVAPILLVVFSSHFLGDKISPRAAAGVALATAGALIIIALPLFLNGRTSNHFYALATVLLLIQNIFFTVGILFSRKSNEAGMPLAANAGLMSVAILVVSFIGMYAVGGLPTNLGTITPVMWIGIFYSGVAVVFVARIMNIASYERIGAATTSGLNYLGTILSIIIPLIALGEKLSSTVVIGGVLILIGVFLTEKHRAKHHKYMHPH